MTDKRKVVKKAGENVKGDPFNVEKKLDIEKADIERAHRAGRRNRNKPRTFVCKLLRFKVKQKRKTSEMN